MWGAARRAVHEATDTGKVTLKTFSNLADGRREVITLDDQAVSRELEKERRQVLVVVGGGVLVILFSAWMHMKEAEIYHPNIIQRAAPVK